MAMSTVAFRYTPPSFSTFPILKIPPPFRNSTKMMSLKGNTSISSLDDSYGKSNTKTRKLPILLFDVMDTIVRDPFYHDIPAFFGYLSLSNSLSLPFFFFFKFLVEYFDLYWLVVNAVKLFQLFFTVICFSINQFKSGYWFSWKMFTFISCFTWILKFM